MTFKVGEVLLANPYVITIDEDEQTHNCDVWMIVTGSDYEDDATVHQLMTSSKKLQKLFDKMGWDRWTVGLKGTEVRAVDPEEWPDEICVKVAQRALVTEGEK